MGSGSTIITMMENDGHFGVGWSFHSRDVTTFDFDAISSIVVFKF
jgi:hypothetical protein